MNPAIQVTNLTKRYDTLTALSKISFSVESGEIVGFLGPNGAGKTTTLRILTGMIDPTDGEVLIDGLDVTTHSLEVRKRIGYLPENVALYPELRIREYLDFRSRIKGIPAAERAAQIAAALERCNLADVSRKLIGRLSKGYRQRVGLADALLGNPKVLILDEPTVGLDPHQIRQTRELIMELGKSTTILLSTHILPEVEMLCSKIVIIHRGKIITVDTPERLRDKLQGVQSLRVQMRGATNAISELKRLPDVIDVRIHGHEDDFTVYDIEVAADQDPRAEIYLLAVQNSWVLRELATSRASLEDIFISLTTKEGA